MNTLNPDQTPQPELLTGQVLVMCRDAYDMLRGLTDSLPREREEDRPEAVDLSSAISRFVTDNLVALSDITEVPHPPYLYDAAQGWLAAVLQAELRQGMFIQTEARSREEITRLLSGRTVRATSITGQGFGIGENWSVTIDPDSPREVEAPFLEVYPATGTLLLGTPEYFYQVPLFETTRDGTTQVANIEVW